MDCKLHAHFVRTFILLRFFRPLCKREFVPIPTKGYLYAYCKKSVFYVYDNLAIIYDVCRAIAKTEAIKKAR